MLTRFLLYQLIEMHHTIRRPTAVTLLDLEITFHSADLIVLLVGKIYHWILWIFWDYSLAYLWARKGSHELPSLLETTSNVQQICLILPFLFDFAIDEVMGHFIGGLQDAGVKLINENYLF